MEKEMERENKLHSRPLPLITSGHLVSSQLVYLLYLLHRINIVINYPRSDLYVVHRRKKIRGKPISEEIWANISELL